MRKARIGLLPMYIALYDNNSPEVRPQMEGFYYKIAQEFEKRGIDVETTEICRLEKEFEDSVRRFEISEVDAIVTLHLAYSPSLESSDVLGSTKLPVLVLDTTPDYEFGPCQDRSRVMFNHGIHGVQDMCNLLVRNDKAFRIEAGHWSNSDVIDRLCRWIRAAHLAGIMKNMRVGIIGQPFKGMGDFFVSKEQLKSIIGLETVECNSSMIREFYESISDDEVNAESTEDSERFIMDNVNKDAYLCSVKTGLAVRKWLKHERLSAFTFNFLDISKKSGLQTVPFLEAGKALSSGYGYAGEGDVLTAGLIGTLGSMYPYVSFVEMFCPGWKENVIFISHMGELNIKLTCGKPALKEIPFSYTDAEAPIVVTGRYIGGEAVLVNLAPGKNDSYTMIIAPIMMQDVDKDDGMEGKIRGWFEPQMPVADFLSEYSRVGGTHHCALVYGDVREDMVKFGEMMGWNVTVI